MALLWGVLAGDCLNHGELTVLRKEVDSMVLFRLSATHGMPVGGHFCQRRALAQVGHCLVFLSTPPPLAPGATCLGWGPLFALRSCSDRFSGS